jgi:hypothetical protein
MSLQFLENKILFNYKTTIILSYKMRNIIEM